MEAHQRLSVLHVNTHHARLHVAINRVQPETHFGYYRLAQACQELEVEFGLTRTNHGLGRSHASIWPANARACLLFCYIHQAGFGC